MQQRQPIPFRGSSPDLQRTGPVPVPDVRRAKLLPPRLPADTVRRPSLEAWLERATDAPLTLVAAGAGFGKTTLVSAWAGATAHRVAWLSLDAEDADLRRFLRHLLAALRTVAPGIAPAVDDLLGGSRKLDPKTAATLLADELLDLPEEVVLVLDDLHAVAGAAPGAFVSELLAYPPPDLRVLATSRVDLAELGLRLPGSLPVKTLRERDLRMRDGEIAALMGDGAGLEPAEVAARTDGWAAGVRALAVAGGAAPERVRTYLQWDVLASQPPGMVAFLRDVAILERMPLDLAAAVSGLTPEQAASLLAHAERRGLFVARLDDAGAWWRIHPLLRDVLREEAAALGQSAEEGHARAAAWFAGQGMVEEAIDHALRAGDPAEAADLAAGFALDWLAGGQDIPYDWIERLNPAEVAARPALMVVQAHRHVVAGNVPAVPAVVAAAWRALERAEAEGEIDAADATALAADIVLARGLAANAGSDPTATLEELGALVASGVGSRRQRNALIGTWTVAMAHVGRAEEALAALEPIALADFRAGDTLSARLLIIPAGINLRLGRLGEARRWLALIDASVASSDSWFSGGWGALLRAVVAWLEGDIAGAEAWARAGRGVASPPATANRQLADVQARALLAQGRVDEARIVAAEDRRRIELSGAAAHLPGLEALEAEIALAAGDRRAAYRWADAAAPALLPDAVRFIDHPVMAQARILLARNGPGDAARAAAALGRLRDHQRATHQPQLNAGTLPLLATAQEAASDRAAALATMREALAGEPGAPPRRFADAGPRALALLAALAADPSEPVAPAAARAITAIRTTGETIAPAAAARPSDPSPLTPRQTEILAMMAGWKTNKEIGEALGITAISARDHVQRICRKLGAGDRRTAVEVARAAGWI